MSATSFDAAAPPEAEQFKPYRAVSRSAVLSVLFALVAAAFGSLTLVSVIFRYGDAVSIGFWTALFAVFAVALGWAGLRAIRRYPNEYTGKLLHMANYPQEGALRGGHIPGAKSVPWARAANEDGTFRSREELEALYGGEAGLAPEDEVVVYCRIGERSSHTWFALQHLLGYEHVRNYDGSWTEWGNSVRVPIERDVEAAT